MLENLGLIPTINWLCREFNNTYSMDILGRIESSEEQIPEELKVPIYRIVQEALNNAIKHAGASRIEVGMGIEGTRGCLLVRDDGKGLDVTPEKSTGLGLRIMQHRCGLIDAELKINSSYTEGTEIKCYFPIENNQKFNQ